MSISLVCLAVMSCLRDQGLVDPDTQDTRPLLMRVTGKALNENHTALSAQRLGELGNPKISLVWRHITLRSEGMTFGSSSVGATPPYAFLLDVLDPPPPEVLNSKSVVIGSFWLYSDGNGNGKLDRITHPDMLPRVRELDSMMARYEERLADLREVAEIREPVPVRDTFHVEASGTLIHSAEGKWDTLFTPSGPEDRGYILEHVFRRYRILDHFNAWESFFALRKKAHDTFEDTVFTEGHAFRFEYHHARRLFPKPGREGEFETRLRHATRTGVAIAMANNLVLGEAVAKGWLDYPYNSFNQPGTDWVAGRSRWYSVLYFPDQASLATVLEAEKRSSFRIDGLDRLHRGYNLLHCDDHYRCRVLSQKDSVIIDLGEKWQYFDPPSSPIVFPVKKFEPVRVQESHLKKFEGRYEYQPFRPAFFFSTGEELWGEFPDIGIRRLAPSDSMTFFSPGEDLQVEFIAGKDGKVAKFLLYTAVLAASGNRGVGVRDPEPADLADIAGKVHALRDRPRGRLAEALRDSLPLRLEYGNDTARLRHHPYADGDSLVMAHPRLPDQAFFPMNDSQLFSASSGNLLTFRRDAKGGITGVEYLRRGEAAYFLPNASRAPILRTALFPAPSGPLDKVVSQSDGSGRDTYTALGEGKRYGCSADGQYLRQGDGWISGFEQPDGSDSISLGSHGGRMVFRLEGMAGKHIRLELKACLARGAKNARINLSLLGGPAPGRGEAIASNHWVDIAKDSLAWEPIPIPVSGDPYYLEIVPSATFLKVFRFSLDSYRILSD